ncbi:MAG: glycosyltransferase family 2 protein [Lachnospiraceae bacterium]|nr:glycosyltransferase family 2 protein [Lachnospiraceae bacterium]
MAASPKVSICIPTYNNVDEVERLLQSIDGQEYKDYEVNISDDSTNDEIENLIRKYEKVNYIHNKKPLGHIFNWNAAIRMAKGEYIKIMFSDDWFTDAHSLGSFAALLDADEKAMLAFSGSRQVMLDGQNIDAMQHVTKEHQRSSYDRYASTEYIEGLRKDYRRLFLGNQIGAPSAVIYRRGSSAALFDEKSNWASDMFLYFDLLQKSNAFAYTKEPLVSIGVHEHQYTESFSDKDMRIYNDYRYLYTKYHLQECPECREYFAEKFLVKYHQGVKEAKALGIETSLYLKKWTAEVRASVQCFVRSRMK